MTEMQLKNLKALNKAEENGGSLEISVPTRCDHGDSLTLDTLIFRDNGALVFTGNFDLEVKRVYNYKDEVSLCDYEFIIGGHDGADAAKAGENGADAKAAGNLNFDFGKIKGDIRIQAAAGRGGRGFDGINGKNGGDGGDGYCGGNGGDGENAKAGTDGGKGGGAPNVDIVYTTIKKGDRIYINGEAAKKKCCISLKGGAGGKGGMCAEGGKGGIGGKGIDQQHNGSCGREGFPAPAGKDGDSGTDGAVKIRKRPINEILDNLSGMYILDLSDEEEREYCINKLGGTKLLNKYEAIKEAINKSSAETKPSIKIALQDSRCSYLTDSELKEAAAGKNAAYGSNTEFGTFSQTFSIDLYDTCNLISDKKEASKWQFITVDVNAVNTSYATGYPVISQNFEVTDTYGGITEFCSEILEANLMEGNIVTKIVIKGIDGNGRFVYAEYGAKVNNASGKKKHKVQNIEVKDPKWNKKFDDGIIMLYGRIDEQQIYSKADYSGGDYFHNTIKSDAKIATLIPFSGTVTFSSDYKPVGLTPPGGAVQFLRPALDYSSKSAGKIDPDIAYQNDITDDMKLYKLLTEQNCFKAVQTVADPHVDFDFSLDRGDNTSKLDWHQDISGENDNRRRVVLLRGNFTYRILRKDFPEDKADNIQISVTSITKENLEKINRNKKEKERYKYYEFMEGGNLIYIPPIYIYWGCLGKNVLLKTADGTLKTAETVKIGDRLLSYGGKAVTVNNIFKGHDETIYRLSCGGLETLMSGSHPVLGENGKGVAVGNLRAGDKIMTENGGMTEVLSVREEPYNDTVYSFTFEGENESVYFIADGIFAGDLNAQNEASEEPQETDDEKEKRLKLIEEMRSLCQEIKSADGNNKQ